MKTALLPAIRVPPALRVKVESVLKEGETVHAFIAAAVERSVAIREVQRALLERGLAAEGRGVWLDENEAYASIGRALKKKAKR